MFIDYIIEGSSIIDEPVSEETMEYLNNAEIPDFSESKRSPFEIMEMSIYEFCKNNTDMYNKIAQTELRYLKENGEEPVWEAADFRAVFDRAIEGLKSLGRMLAGATQSLLKMIDDKINEFYQKHGEKISEKLKKANETGLLKKMVFTYTDYKPEIGKDLLNKAQSPANVFGKVSELKAIYNLVISVGPTQNYLDKTYTKEELGSVNASVIIKALMGDIGSDLNDISSARKALVDKMAPEKTKHTWKESYDATQLFRSDPRGSKSKNELKTMYKSVNKTIGVLIDRVKKYKKDCEKGDKVSSSLAGGALKLINTYSSLVSMIYKETTFIYTKRWIQSLSLANRMVKDAKNDVKEANK